jgi:hypothetical protein
MLIDQQQDVMLTVIAGLCRAAVHGTLAEDALKAVFSDPRDLSTAAAHGLPMLAIYRGGEKKRRQDSATIVQDVTVVFEYALPATAGQKRAERWPALSAIWNVIADTMIAGRYPSIGGVNTLDVLGAAYVHENSLSVEYGFAAGGSESYPYFRGTMLFTHSPDELIDRTADLDDFLINHVAFNGPGGDFAAFASVDPLLPADTTELPASDS